MIRIVRGSSAPPPPPPLTPPPSPQYLCKIGVVGDSQSGKTAIMQKFVCRAPINIHAQDEERNQGPLDCDDTNTNGSSLQARSNVSVETNPTLAEYSKKDVTIFSQEHQACSCLRMQIWDMNLHYHVNVMGGQDVSTTASIPSNASWSTNQPTADVSTLLPLINKVDSVIVCCRCPHPPSSPSLSSNASITSLASGNASSAEWPGLATIEESVEQWVRFLRDREHSPKRKQTLHVALTCADLVIGGYSPREWIQLSAKMQCLCELFNLTSWRICTCISIDGVFGEEAFCQYSDPSSLSYSMQVHQRLVEQQSQLLEDAEAAVERMFVEIMNEVIVS